MDLSNIIWLLWLIIICKIDTYLGTIWECIVRVAIGVRINTQQIFVNVTDKYSLNKKPPRHTFQLNLVICANNLFWKCSTSLSLTAVKNSWELALGTFTQSEKRKKHFYLYFLKERSYFEAKPTAETCSQYEKI